MSFIWVFQLGICVVLVSLIVWWVLDRRRILKSSTEHRVTACLKVLESRAGKQEIQWHRFQQQMKTELKSLHKIGSRAQKILERNQHSLSNSIPSLEECELRAVVNDAPSQSRAEPIIPTLKELEKTHNRLKSEASYGLEDLLKEQLA